MKQLFNAKRLSNSSKVTLLWVATISCNVSANTIEEIIVLGERISHLAGDANANETVINQQAIARQNADHPSEILALAPGVNMNRGSGAEHLSAIRSPVLTGGAGAGSFLYLQNGVPLRSAGFANTNGMLDAPYELAESIAVIRGPSGPLYGDNAVHGLVDVALPKAGGNNSFNISGDTQDRYKNTATLAGQAGAHAWRVGSAITQESGYRLNAGLRQQKAYLRHAYAGHSQQVDTLFSAHNIRQNTAGYIEGADALNDRELRRENSNPDAYREAQSVHWQSKISPIDNNQEGQWHWQITPFARWHTMEFLQHFLPSQAVENNGHWSIGSQSDIALRSGKWRWRHGLDVEYTEGDLREFQARPTVFSYTQGLHYDYTASANSAALFTQATYQWTELFSIEAGLRVNHTRYQYQNHATTGTEGRFLRIADQDDSFTTANPAITAYFQANDQLQLSLSAKRASRAPQTSDLYRLQVNQTSDEAKAEKLDALEFNAKYHFHDKFAINLALFDMAKQNYFFRDADGFNINNGKTDHRGIEIALDAALTDSLLLNSVFSYAEHRYRFDRVVSRDSEVIRSGNFMDSAPRIVATTQLTWQASETASWQLQWQTLSDYYTDAANAHQYEGHDLLHLRIDFALPGNQGVQLSIRNLTDTLYAERADFAFGNERFFPGEPRTIGLSYSHTW